jgi:hypothetical protein
LHQLHQDSPGAPGVEKGHEVAPGPRARLTVDELQALLPEAGEGGPQVRDPVGDVVKGGTPALQKAPHCRGGLQGLQELDGPDELDPDPLAHQLFHRGGLVSAQETEEAARLLQ